MTRRYELARVGDTNCSRRVPDEWRCSEASSLDTFDLADYQGGATAFRNGPLSAPPARARSRLREAGSRPWGGKT
jgi:hypothetical protein